MRRANSQQIASMAGVSRSVVSKVINGSADRYGIAAKAQERLRTAIRHYGYTPDMTLRNMFLKQRELVKVDGVAPDPARVKAAVEPGINPQASKSRPSPSRLTRPLRWPRSQPSSTPAW